MQVSAGGPQGSVLGPTLWYGMYNGVLQLTLPVGSEVIGFADDIVLTVRAQSLKEVALNAERAFEVVESWMGGRGLRVAHHETEMVVISNLQAIQLGKITVEGREIITKRPIRYFGLMIGDRLSFKNHAEYAASKASRVLAAVEGMIRGARGPRSSRRRFLASVVREGRQSECQVPSARYH